MTKGELIKFLEPFLDEIPIEIEIDYERGIILKPFYFHEDTGKVILECKKK